MGRGYHLPNRLKNLPKEYHKLSHYGPEHSPGQKRFFMGYDSQRMHSKTGISINFIRCFLMLYYPLSIILEASSGIQWKLLSESCIDSVQP